MTRAWCGVALRGVRILPIIAVWSTLSGSPAAVGGQERTTSRAWTLQGRVLVGDTALSEGTVVLHEVTSEEQGEIDSVGVNPDGSFHFPLPAPPNRILDHFYFASVRHHGILYFGSAVADTAQLDTAYVIQAYDTIGVSRAPNALVIQARNTFFEPNGEEWRVTDIFQLRNDSGRTLVAPEEDVTWSYPLPAGARDFMPGQGEFALDGANFRDGVVSVRAAIAPGERVFVFRYNVDEPYGPVPSPGHTEAFDLLLREPSPRVGVEGLDFVGRVELEAGSTYRRFSGTNVGPGRVRVVPVRLQGDLPVEWITVVVGLALALAAVVLLRRESGVGTAVAPTAGSGSRSGGAGARQALLIEIARLDEEFESRSAPTDEERAAYRARREELLTKLASNR